MSKPNKTTKSLVISVESGLTEILMCQCFIPELHSVKTHLVKWFHFTAYPHVRYERRSHIASNWKHARQTTLDDLITVLFWVLLVLFAGPQDQRGQTFGRIHGSETRLQSQWKTSDSPQESKTKFLNREQQSEWGWSFPKLLLWIWTNMNSEGWSWQTGRFLVSHRTQIDDRCFLNEALRFVISTELRAQS